MHPRNLPYSWIGDFFYSFVRQQTQFTVDRSTYAHSRNNRTIHSASRTERTCRGRCRVLHSGCFNAEKSVRAARTQEAANIETGFEEKRVEA